MSLSKPKGSTENLNKPIRSKSVVRISSNQQSTLVRSHSNLSKKLSGKDKTTEDRKLNMKPTSVEDTKSVDSSEFVLYNELDDYLLDLLDIKIASDAAKEKEKTLSQLSTLQTKLKKKESELATVSSELVQLRTATEIKRVLGDIIANYDQLENFIMENSLENAKLQLTQMNLEMIDKNIALPNRENVVEFRKLMLVLQGNLDQVKGDREEYKQIKDLFSEAIHGLEAILAKLNRIEEIEKEVTKIENSIRRRQNKWTRADA